MAVAHPASVAKSIVIAALTEYATLTALVPTGDIQVWGGAVGLNDQIEDQPERGKRIWVVPLKSDFDLNESSGQVRHVRRFRIGYGTGDMKLDDLIALERQIQLALGRLNGLKKANGDPLDSVPNVDIQSAGVSGTDPERDPIDDPEEWTDLYDVAVLLYEPRSVVQ